MKLRHSKALKCNEVASGRTDGITETSHEPPKTMDEKSCLASS